MVFDCVRKKRAEEEPVLVSSAGALFPLAARCVSLTRLLRLRCSFAFLPQDTTSRESRKTARAREETAAREAPQKRRSSLWDPRETTSKARALSGGPAENDTNDACWRARASSRLGGVRTAEGGRQDRGFSTSLRKPRGRRKNVQSRPRFACDRGRKK
ncbi:hypothetical protein TGME49_251650 [Toxoplasma gondii ME49]|uniref:Uncharacterized protein n=2 Tax=Toxoplasma gondii TaxID=5811 RepID=B6KHT3_TOXGV|nr:hypothetical protein TGME49_251650 [Toxoplasma gondii ME49]EPT25229.1 hypothetical protein TGME49_251650 [Toxoplasma gondii ME49]ESS34569.1 hypothetical protein TGVEG_251650 [Toxoplasma gondii VEG]|eukprot:XP_002367406.1 hypothetical protein TGME49_251650 [Toxoplasma gondii ME49]